MGAHQLRNSMRLQALTNKSHPQKSLRLSPEAFFVSHCIPCSVTRAPIAGAGAEDAAASKAIVDAEFHQVNLGVKLGPVIEAI